MRRTWIIVGFVAISFIAVGFAASSQTKELRFGIFPSEGPKVMFQKYARLAEYLSKEVGLPVAIVVAKDYQTAIDQLGRGEVDFALMSSSLYPKCEKQYPSGGVKPIIRFKTGNTGLYAGYIVAGIDSGITDIAGLKGKKMAVASEDSGTSNLLQRMMLMEAGIDIKKDLAQYEYLGNQGRCVEALKNKTFEAIGVKATVAVKCEKDGIGKIIAKSRDIPTEPICINNKLDPAIAGKLKAALLELDVSSDADKAILTAIDPLYTGCEEAKSSDYDYMREVIHKLYGDDFYKKK